MPYRLFYNEHLHLGRIDFTGDVTDSDIRDAFRNYYGVYTEAQRTLWDGRGIKTLIVDLETVRIVSQIRDSTIRKEAPGPSASIVARDIDSEVSQLIGRSGDKRFGNRGFFSTMPEALDFLGLDELPEDGWTHIASSKGATGGAAS
ncbi:hypothetical protein BH23BAC4_BH23BAC4_09390 [soil metagenome]